MFRRVLILAALVLGCGVSVSAQGYRIGDSQTVGSSLTASTPIIPLQATVAVCVNPANAVPCTNKATTFTSVTIAVSCPTSTQVVLAGTTTCVTQTDSRGNWGAWVAAGNYDITYTLPTGQSFGPYTISVGFPPGTAIAPGNVTVSGNLSALPGQNQILAYNTNGDAVIDANFYPATQAGFTAAASGNGRKVFIPAGTSVAISSCPITIGSGSAASSKPFTIEARPSSGFPSFVVTCTGNNDVFHLGDSVLFSCGTPTGAAPCVQVNSTAVINDVFAPVNVAGTQEDYFLRDVNVNFTNATMNGAVVDLTSMADFAEVSHVLVSGTYVGTGKCFLIAPGNTLGGGPMWIHQNWCDANSNNNPAYVFNDGNGTNFTAGIKFEMNEAQNTGTASCITFTTASIGHLRHIFVDGFLCSGNTATKQIDVNGLWNSTLRNLQLITSAASGVTGIFIESTLNVNAAIRIENAVGDGAGFANLISDQASSPTFVSGYGSGQNFNYFAPGATGTLSAFNDTLQIRRLRFPFATAISGGNFSLSAGWGTTASIASSNGSDATNTIQVNSNGTGQAANPTLTITFQEGTFTNTPNCLAGRGDDTSAPVGTLITCTVISATQMRLMFVGTPVAGTGYKLTWWVTGP